MLENHIRAIKAIEKVATQAAARTPTKGLPASEPGRSLLPLCTIVDDLEHIDVEVVLDPERDPRDHSYELDLSADGRKVRAKIGNGLVTPTIAVGETTYNVQYAAARPIDPPVVIRNRPRRIIFNTAHPAHHVADRATKFDMSLALELAYLLDRSSAAAVYETMLEFLEAL